MEWAQVGEDFDRRNFAPISCVDERKRPPSFTERNFAFNEPTSRVEGGE
jgi:hypothetical protein